jgi:predicted RNA-binding protein with RPS1 domain
MKQEEQKQQIKEKLEGLNRQIHQLKVQVVDASVKDSYDRLIRELEEKRDRIREKYDQMEGSAEEDWSKLDKNIYADLESFNTSFKKAGALFKPRQT